MPNLGSGIILCPNCNDSYVIEADLSQCDADECVKYICTFCEREAGRFLYGCSEECVGKIKKGSYGICSSGILQP